MRTNEETVRQWKKLQDSQGNSGAKQVLEQSAPAPRLRRREACLSRSSWCRGLKDTWRCCFSIDKQWSWQLLRIMALNATERYELVLVCREAYMAKT